MYILLLLLFLIRPNIRRFFDNERSRAVEIPNRNLSLDHIKILKTKFITLFYLLVVLEGFIFSELITYLSKSIGSVNQLITILRIKLSALITSSIDYKDFL